MHLSTKGRFAVTAMIDLAVNSKGDPVSLSSISQRQKISLSYLEQLFSRLRRGDLVMAVRGPGGGYTLTKKAQQITIADIILAVDEPIDLTECGPKGVCQNAVANNSKQCLTHNLWTELNHRVISYLDSVFLSTFIESQGASTSSQDGNHVKTGDQVVTVHKTAARKARTT